MKIHLIAIGQRMPEWVNTAYHEYAKRLPSDYALMLKALPAEKRSKQSNPKTILQKESEALLVACPTNAHIIALDRLGKAIDTRILASHLQSWHDQSQDIALLIGGPEGISSTCLQKARTVWSLSKLTLPHPLARILIAEQIYRAFSILSNHPYHRDTPSTSSDD